MEDLLKNNLPIIYNNLNKHMIKKKEKSKLLIDAVFLDKTGKKKNVKDIVTEDECWYLKRENKFILTHAAIKKIAFIAGISKNYDVDESPNIVPTYQNELEHVVRVTIHCLAKKGKKVGCVHSDEDILTITGEANRMSAPNRGRNYLRKMAEKRAFDIAVLEHLNLYSSVFSEEEADKFERKKEPDIMPGTKSFEEIVKEINLILNAKDIISLKKIAKNIKEEVKKEKYTEKQLVYLRALYEKEYGKKNINF